MAVVKIEGLPVMTELEQEGYTFSKTNEKALKVAVMNLMPLKEKRKDSCCGAWLQYRL